MYRVPGVSKRDPPKLPHLLAFFSERKPRKRVRGGEHSIYRGSKSLAYKVRFVVVVCVNVALSISQECALKYTALWCVGLPKGHTLLVQETTKPYL